MPAEPLVSLHDFRLERRSPDGLRPVLHGIDLEIHPGQWLALLGANGAGKSSLLRWLASDASPAADCAAIVFQDPDEQLIATTVVRELALGHATPFPPRVVRDFGLSGLEDMDPRLLSAGQKQRLVLAVALAQEPALLLCDEPVALQDDEQAAWVLDRLEQWRRETGGALVTATCDRRELERADRLVVLEQGRILLQGPPGCLLARPEVQELVGPLPAEPVPRPAAVAADPRLRMRDVTMIFAGPGGGFGPLDLTVHAGERVGIHGPNGCGKSTLLAVAVGLRAPAAGTVELSGHSLAATPGRPDLDHGRAAFAPQFPEYAFARSTVADEIALDPCLAGIEPGSWLIGVGLPAAAARLNPHDLSTGQRRRLALGLALASRRSLLVLDEPTAALDRAGRRMVLALLDAVPPDAGLLIASHDLEFLAAAGCRLVLLGPREGGS